MKEITFTLKAITPIIMSGIDNKNVEIRTQSIKGILRFWYRFWKFSEVNNISDLKTSEEKIWGSQKKASTIKMKIENTSVLNPTSNKITDAYLCMNDSSSNTKSYNKIKRKALKQEEIIKLNISFMFNLPDNDDNYFEEFKKTLKLLHYCGGIGARWRRGFGSIMIKEFQKPSLEEIKKDLKSLLPPIKSDGKKDFMCISNVSIYFVEPNNTPWKSWEEAMNFLRNNFYRKLKKNLSISSIGSFNPRKASPLIIQIKKLDNVYYGVLLVWKKWEKYNDFKNFLAQLDFKISEVYNA